MRPIEILIFVLIMASFIWFGAFTFKCYDRGGIILQGRCVAVEAIEVSP